MRFISLLSILFLFSSLSAQTPCTEGRYAAPVFDCVDTTRNVPYGQGRRDWSSTNILCQHGNLPPYNSFQTLLADIYEPCNDTETARPLLIVIHGGAFAAGNKADMAPFCTEMAKRGYVVASISYRLAITQNILCWNAEVDEIKFTRAFYRAMQDAKAAVRYFRANAAQYGIDPDNIFVGGHSAGAFTALGVGYITDDALRPQASFQQSYCGNWQNQPVCADLGGIEGEGGNPGVSSAVKGVASMAGAIPDLSYIAGPDEPPLLLVHGTADDVVPYGAGCVLQSLGPLFNPCIFTYGAGPVFAYADSIGMDVELLTFPGGGHSFTNAQLDSIYIRLSRFLCCRMGGSDCQTVSSLQNFSTVSAFELFPNPSAGWVQIRTELEAPWEALLYDMTGRPLERYPAATGSRDLDLGRYPSGLYTLQIRQADGQVTALRVVKR